MIIPQKKERIKFEDRKRKRERENERNSFSLLFLLLRTLSPSIFIGIYSFCVCDF